MPTKLIMPQLGESVTEGTIGKWLKKAGDPIARYEPLVEVITDKVNAEIPSPVDGVLTSIFVQDGETVKVGEIIAQLDDVSTSPNPREEHSPSTLSSSVVPPSLPSNNPVESPSFVSAVPSELPVGNATENHNDEENGERKRLTPAVRRVIEEYHVDIKAINGSGLNGRVTRDDVLHYVAEQGAPADRSLARSTLVTPPLPPSSPSVTTVLPPRSADSANNNQAQAPLQAPPKASPGNNPGDEVVILSPIRQAIANHMVRSVSTSPHAWTLVEIDMTNLVRYRTRVKEEFKKREGVDLTFLPFFIRAVVEGLKKFPDLNALWQDDHIVRKRAINIGVAVDVPEGLLVPVIHDADQKSISGLAHSLADLTSGARTRHLSLTDMQGGTFTVNNPGSFGSILSQPIINQPQAAIVTMEQIVKRPIVTSDEAIAIRSIMNSCISFDHRMLDGATAGHFLQTVKQWLEKFNPDQTI